MMTWIATYFAMHCYLRWKAILYDDMGCNLYRHALLSSVDTNVVW